MKKEILHSIFVLCVGCIQTQLLAQSLQSNRSISPVVQKVQIARSSERASIQNVTVAYHFFKGVNLFSFSNVPFETDFKKVFLPLIESKDLIKVHDGNGRSLEYFPINGEWINALGDVSTTKAYKVYVSEECILYVNGLELPPIGAINLQKGWNLMPYHQKEEQSALLVLKDLIKLDVLELAKDEEGNTLEKDEQGNWQNRIGNFKPHKAYELKLKRDYTLKF